MSDFNFSIDPTGWSNDKPNYFLGISGFSASGPQTYTVTGKVSDAHGQPLGSFNFTSNGHGLNPQQEGISFQNSNWPVKVNGSITSPVPMKQSNPTQPEAVGTKDGDLPICYESSIFCNDGSDDDWNDLVLNFQLFNNSTD